MRITKMDQFVEELKKGTFTTDSDIEDYASDHKMNCRDLFNKVNEISYPKCKGCEHIGLVPCFYPCTICNRCQTLKDMYSPVKK